MNSNLSVYSSTKISSDRITLPFHPSFYPTFARLKKWLNRFFFTEDTNLFFDIILFYSLAKKKYLDHRKTPHLSRLILSMYVMQKKLVEQSAFSSVRHIRVRCIPTKLLFPFSSESVVGCIVGFNLIDRGELFDEQNLVIALQKRFADLEFVKESSYRHASQNEDIRLCYFEVKQKDNQPFSAEKVRLIQEDLRKKIEHSIQKLTLPICNKSNQEEIYKSLFILGNEIQTIYDVPQVRIQIEKRLETGILFLITIVQLAPLHRFSFKDRICGCLFISEQILPVKELDDHLVEARVIRALLPLTPSLVRVDGSLDQPAARQQISDLLKNIIGEFRDYNGGLLIKQQELLSAFKEECKQLTEEENEWVDHFFYSLSPLERQVTLQPHLVHTLFLQFLETRQENLSPESCYSFRTYAKGRDCFIVVRARDPGLLEPLPDILRDHSLTRRKFVYNMLEVAGNSYFSCLLLEADPITDQALITRLQDRLQGWSEKRRKQQVLRIALDFPICSLDPRIGGESSSGDTLRLLFEGLTRFNSKGELENGVAESIEISSDFKRYCFRLRPSLWNDGTVVSADDFAYAWKMILSPDFKTQFATLLYPISNAREAREGKVPADAIGITVIDDRTLQVDLTSPTPYFLDLVAQPAYFPVNRRVDQQFPQWPYQTGKDYSCNGPFQLKVNDPNRGYHLTKNPYYWDFSNIMLDQILLKPMDPFRAVQAFQNDEVDWVGNPFGGWYSSVFSGQKDSRIISVPNNWVCWCVFNTTHRLFRHHKWRQAFAHAVDRSRLCQNTFPQLSPAYSLLLPQCRVTRASLFPDYHLEKARVLFQEALQELNLTVGDLAPITLTFTEKGLREQIALGLKQQLEECFGIQCNLKPLPWNVVFPRLIDGDFELALFYWTSWIDDPIYTLNAFRFANQGMNVSGWESLEFQQTLDRSEQEPNPFQRSSHLLEAEKILSQEIPAIPLIYQPFQATTKTNLHIEPKASGGALGIARCFFKQEISNGSITTKSRNNF